MTSADVNRSVALIRPRTPYLEWAAANGDGVEYPTEDERTVYLLPVFLDDTDREVVLRKHCKAIFEAELEAWSRDESTWPRRRTYAEFLRWFEVEQDSVVVDLAAGEEIYDGEL